MQAEECGEKATFSLALGNWERVNIRDYQKRIDTQVL